MNMKLLIVAMAALTLSSAQLLTELHTKTTDCASCGMIPINPGVDVEIVNQNFQPCLTLKLNTKHGRFVRDEIDVFYGDELDECQDFPMPGGVAPLVRVTHHGIDAWGYDWLRMVLDDDTVLFCPNNNGPLDNTATHSLNCTKVQ